MNLARLQACAAPRAELESYGPADDLRRRFDTEWNELRAIELGEVSRFGLSGSTRPLTRGAGTGIEAAPFCGDCFARRSANGPCGACGSTQPANLSRMNPRAARSIGQAPYR